MNVWNIGWQPTQTELDGYECRHGLGYTVISGRKNGVEARQEMFVPCGDDCLLMRVSVKNTTDAVKALTLFGYVEFCLWDAIDDASNFQRNYSVGEVEVTPRAITSKPNTASDATITPCCGQTRILTALTPRATRLSACTARPWAAACATRDRFSSSRRACA